MPTNASLFLLLITLFSLAACQQEDTDPNGKVPAVATFERTLSLQRRSYATDVVELPDSSFLLTGYTRTATGTDQLLLLKINPQGDTLWSRHYFFNNRSNIGTSMIATQDGGCVIAFTTEDYAWSYPKMALAKVDAQGSVLWQKELGPSNEGLYGAGNLVETTTGDYLVIANPYEGSQTDYTLHKVNKAGVLVWSRQYPGVYAGDIQPTKDNHFVITGTRLNRNSDVFLTKINSQGSILWDKVLGDDKINHAHAVVQTPDGGFAITGHTQATNLGRQVMLLKTNEAGDQQFLKHFGGQMDDVGLCIEVTQSNQMMIGGYANTSDLIGELLAIRVSLAGEELSRAQSAGTTGRYFSLVNTSDQGILFCGHQQNALLMKKTRLDLTAQ